MSKRIIASVVAAGLLGAACTPVTDDMTGAELYEVSCSGCHGPDLTGSTGPAVGPNIGPDSNADLVLTDEQIAGVISVGPGSMPSFGNSLSQAQIDSLVAYLRSVQDA